jgi:hypothetical protein
MFSLLPFCYTKLFSSTGNLSIFAKGKLAKLLLILGLQQLPSLPGRILKLKSLGIFQQKEIAKAMEILAI